MHYEGSRRRIVLAKNFDYPEGIPWPWTAYLEEWDGTSWRYAAAEDGDTPEEAEATLRAEVRLARDATVEAG